MNFYNTVIEFNTSLFKVILLLGVVIIGMTYNVGWTLHNVRYMLPFNLLCYFFSLLVISM